MSEAARDMHELVDTIQPAWVPSANELDDIAILIDPLGGGLTDSREHRFDDLAVMTGAYLFHLVQAAGGVPIMIRADDRRPPAARGDVPSGEISPDAPTSTDLSVAIDFVAEENTAVAEQKKVGLRALCDNPSAQSLARCLAEALDLTEVRTGLPPGEDVPAQFESCGAIAILPAPGRDAPTAEAAALPRRYAERIFKGIAAFVEANRAALLAARSTKSQDARSPARSPVPRFIDRTADQELAALAKRVWPNGNLPVDRAEWFCRMCIAVGLSDRTFTYLQPTFEIKNDAVIVGGATNVAMLQNTVVDLLRAAGVSNVRNEMRLLPEEGRLGGERFGACIASMALTYSEPSETAGLRTQLLYGEPVRLLDRDAAYILVHADDGYWGWVRQDCIRTLTPDEFAQYSNADQAVLLRDHESADRRIVRGASLPVASAGDDRITLMQPDGATIDIPAADARIVDSARFAENRLNAALSFLHRPYVYGGVSPIGLDCSGLVRNVFQQFGPFVGRDAAQQFVQGRLVATRWQRDGIRAGDLLYFVNRCGRIFHVAIALSSTHFVHAAPPEVTVSSLQEKDRLYRADREATFLAARRL